MKIKRILSGALAAVIAATAMSVTTFAAKPKSISLEGYEVIDAARLDHVQFKTDKPHAMTFSINGGTATVAFWRQENKPVMKGRKDAFVYYLEDDNTTSGLGMRLESDVLDYEGELLELPIGNYVILWNDTDYADMVYWVNWGKANGGTYDFSKDKKVTYRTGSVPEQETYLLRKGRTVNVSDYIDIEAGSTFKSSNKNVLTVSSDGTIKVVGSGDAYVTVKKGKKTTKVYFNVMP